MLRLGRVAAVVVAFDLVVTGRVAAPPPWNGSAAPFGAFDDAFLDADGSVRVAGWADEADEAASVAVLFFVPGHFIGLATADQARPNVKQVYSGSAEVGFSAQLSGEQVTEGGVICVSAVNRGAGHRSVLGCRIIRRAAASTASTTDATTTTTTPPPAVRPRNVVASESHALVLEPTGTVMSNGLAVYSALCASDLPDPGTHRRMIIPGNPKVIGYQHSTNGTRFTTDETRFTRVDWFGTERVAQLHAAEQGAFYVLEDGTL